MNWIETIGSSQICLRKVKINVRTYGEVRSGKLFVKILSETMTFKN